jgi:ADP-heptose:LPS heptosyltransferase
MKILFLRLGGIGDILLTTAALKSVKEKLPSCEVHYFAGEKAAPILENNPYIDKLIIYRESHIKARRLAIVRKQAQWFKETFNDIKYDYVIDLESNYHTAYISTFIPAKERFGFTITDWRRAAYNLLYSKRFRFDRDNIYLAEKYLAILLFLNITPGDTKTTLAISPAEKKKAQEYFASTNPKGTKILLSDSGDWVTKKWPAEYWAKLIELVSAEKKDVTFYALAGPGNENTIQYLISKNYQNLYVTPKSNLRDFAALVSCGDILVSCDSGVRHIGVALGLKTIGLFGPINETNWSLEDDKTKVITAGPLECRPCHKSKCVNKEKDIRCMTLIKPERVYQVLMKLM